MNTLQKLQKKEDDEWISAFQSKNYTKVEQRVLCQLMEAVIYEGIVIPKNEQSFSTDFEGHLVLSGKTKEEKTVDYIFYCKRKFSFDRFRIIRGTVKRKGPSEETTEATLPGFVEEVIGQVQKKERLMVLLEELEHTLAKDLQAQYQRPEYPLSETQRNYDELEANIIEAHPYHPCYKSRIGFSLRENLLYGPEFKTKLKPVWLAVSKSESNISLSNGIDYISFIKEELGSKTYEEFISILNVKGLNAIDYWFMPVHPWQWEKIILPGFHRQLAEKKILLLGQGVDFYSSQQSIRTWTNSCYKEKAYIKQALNITNTSTKRILAEHTVMNAPLVSDWLLSLIKDDKTAKKLDFFFLSEFVGISYDYQKLPSMVQSKTYGSLGVIWRQSLHRYLRDDEKAVPLNAISHMDGVQPFIEPWIRKYGLETWTRQLLNITITPIIHMLYAHGIAMESHAQNIILIHKEGFPSRLALKDFHDGLRFSKKNLKQPAACPDLHLEPAHHREINRHSFMQTDDLSAVTNFMHSAFFFVCISELCIYLNEKYGLKEKYFWEMVAQVIHDYQKDHPQYKQNFKLFDLFSKTIQIEQLARRRMWKDTEVGPKSVPNPLHQYR
ncbi:IucA/IucC family siderophore biosynthesis protein [Salibacterium salarium]|uniref:IucA/IucC family siderophore biosynthesis protein n=1 Tax=Salibacterium salarium TaxID=284579 RepID=A0A3R9QQ02_9BACI|nr:IucA/IucC family protein [Salibacterium salarium]RSL35031.1 IucA/IucC family siderophore biosynthesis protein [Salibacterium salarium]